MMEKDPPIQPQAFLGGVTVVDIGDLRVARGLSRRPSSSCPHVQLHYDQQERRVWCADCEMNIEGFDAFTLVVEHYDSALKRLEKREQQLKELEGFQARTLAAKALDKAWRSRSMVPVCPACRGGLFPDDFKNGVGMMNRDFAMRSKARR